MTKPKNWKQIPMYMAVFNYKKMVYQRRRFADPEKRKQKNEYQNRRNVSHRADMCANTARWRRNNPERAAEHLEYLHSNRCRFDVRAYVMRRWKEWAHYVLLANVIKPGCTGHCKTHNFESTTHGVPRVYYHRRICPICIQIMDHVDCPCCGRRTEPTTNYAELQRHRWGETARQDHILIMCEAEELPHVQGGGMLT